MATIKKEATIIFTQEFTLDKPSLVKCLPESLCWKIYKSTGDVLICRTRRYSWCRQEAESLILQERLTDHKHWRKRNQWSLEGQSAEPCITPRAQWFKTEA